MEAISQGESTQIPTIWSRRICRTSI